MQEVENVRVVVRLKPLSKEEIEDGIEDLSQISGQVLTMRNPKGLFL
jgi:hypothetical protein